MLQSNSKGFTLIEMAIVLLIIGVLVGVIFRNIGGQTALARDSRRILELRNVTNYLTVYLAKYGRFPTSTSWADLESALRNAGIVDKLPKDPSGLDYKYFYCTDINQLNTPNHFILGAQLEEGPISAPRLWDGAVTSTTWQCNVQNISSECDANAKKYCIAF